MCPKDDTDAEELRTTFSDNMRKAWRELDLDVRSEVYVLDNCHTFDMSTDIDGQKTAGKMRVDSRKGIFTKDGTLVVRPDRIANCKIFFNDN